MTNSQSLLEQVITHVLEKLRVENGYTQTELAARVAALEPESRMTQQAQVSRVLGRKAPLKVDDLHVLARALGTNIVAVIDEAESVYEDIREQDELERQRAKRVSRVASARGASPTEGPASTVKKAARKRGESRDH